MGVGRLHVPQHAIKCRQALLGDANRDHGSRPLPLSIQVVEVTLPLWHIDVTAGGGVHPIAYLLDDVRRELLGPAAYAAFEKEAKELLSRDAPDPTLARRALEEARKEPDNIMNATRAGIVNPGTKSALETAKAGVIAATEALAMIERFST